jgi:hypothetical protein
VLVRRAWARHLADPLTAVAPSLIIRPGRQGVEAVGHGAGTQRPAAGTPWQTPDAAGIKELHSSVDGPRQMRPVSDDACLDELDEDAG